MRSLPALAALALLPALASGGDAPSVESLRWARSWPAAVEEAQARNVPIVVHRHGFY